ncbi:MAG: M23 family metallopeptidase [Chlorobi bacterium]|nr:M23 family metallopeptidase [Chlorobiota bacterium]
MRQFYYFSKNKLKFVEIKNFYSKFVFLILFFSLLSSFFVLSGYFIIDKVLNPGSEVNALKTENAELAEKFTELLGKYKEVNNRIERLYGMDNDLRIAINLEPIPKDERITGLGGSVFEDVPITNSTELRSVLKELNNYVATVDAKLNYEFNNYSEIKSQYKENELLFESIPAIKPIDGRYGDRFGMRLHPILKIKKMHNGIDIVADKGTKVFAPGAGKVIFAGYKRTTGNTIEIDHGFGYQTRYFHLSKLNVRKGQKVKRGELLGLSGRTGTLCNGPHLHYEVRYNGVPLNPRKFIFDDVNLFEVVNNKSNEGKL